jgi:hypothetical protein
LMLFLSKDTLFALSTKPTSFLSQKLKSRLCSK